MTRLLYWNLMKFSQSKIYNPDTRTAARFQEPGSGGLSKNMAAAEREDYIEQHFNITNSVAPIVYFPPDFVFVVELVSNKGIPGRLATGNGIAGTQHLLDWVRYRTNNVNFMMVPPVRIGPKEAVAVFYNSTSYAFTGPWHWLGGTGPAFDPNIRPNPLIAGYPAAFAPYQTAALIPTGARNAGLAQNQMAPGGSLTYNAAHANAGLPVYDTDVERMPYWVTFAQFNAGGVQREFSFFIFHSPASFLARNYLRRASRTAEITDGQAANEVRMVLGDFNLNLMTYAAGMPLSTPYANLVAANYQLGIDRPGPPPAPIGGYGGYFTTLMRSRKKAKYNGKPTDPPADYPGYLYADLRPNDPTVKRTFWSIDNIVANVGAGAGGPLQNVTILNGVSGSPYNLYPSPGGAPQGFYEFPVWMTSAAYAYPQPQTSPPWTGGRERNFRTWSNYGRIRKTSDHCALMADV